jgi:hypothetical protein
MLGAVSFLTDCEHMDVLQMKWSTIQRYSEASARAWHYTPAGEADVTFEPMELAFWKIREFEDGKTVFDKREEELGAYGLDDQESDLGLAYVYEILKSLELRALHRFDSAIQVTMWAILTWVISDLGWNYLLAPTYPGSPPRSPLAWGISMLPTAEEPLGVSVTLAQIGGRHDVETTTGYLLWEMLLWPDKLEDLGDEVSCASCGVVAHCLKRLRVSDEEDRERSVHLCSHCREVAFRNNKFRFIDDHVPSDEGGDGEFSDYDCLRYGSVRRPFCEGTPDCKWNHYTDLVATKQRTVEQRVQEQTRLIQAGEHDLVKALQAGKYRGLLS